MSGAPVKLHTGSMVPDLVFLILGVLIYAASVLYFAGASRALRTTEKDKRSPWRLGRLLIVPVLGLGVAVFGALRLSDARHWGFWALLAFLALLGLAYLLMRRFMRRKLEPSG